MDETRPTPPAVDRTDQALAALDASERTVLTLRLGVATGRPSSVVAVRRRCRVTPRQVRQLEARALSKLRHPSAGILHPDFLPSPLERSLVDGGRSRSGQRPFARR